MKLFYKPGACSLASHITLRESGKDFTLDGVDLMKKRLENGDDFFAVNPKGQVPALLLDDGTLLTEGVAIMQYLADSVPDRQLLAPVSSISRYKTLEWLNYIATELHKGFTPLFRPDTPEEYKPTVRALLEKKCSTLMPRSARDNGFAARVSLSQMPTFSPCCAGRMRSNSIWTG